MVSSLQEVVPIPFGGGVAGEENLPPDHQAVQRHILHLYSFETARFETCRVYVLPVGVVVGVHGTPLLLVIEVHLRTLMDVVVMMLIVLYY